MEKIISIAKPGAWRLVRDDGSDLREGDALAPGETIRAVPPVARDGEFRIVIAVDEYPAEDSPPERS